MVMNKNSLLSVILGVALLLAAVCWRAAAPLATADDSPAMGGDNWDAVGVEWQMYGEEQGGGNHDEYWTTYLAGTDSNYEVGPGREDYPGIGEFPCSSTAGCSELEQGVYNGREVYSQEMMRIRQFKWDSYYNTYSPRNIWFDKQTLIPLVTEESAWAVDDWLAYGNDIRLSAQTPAYSDWPISRDLSGGESWTEVRMIDLAFGPNWGSSCNNSCFDAHNAEKRITITADTSVTQITVNGMVFDTYRLVKNTIICTNNGDQGCRSPNGTIDYEYWDVDGALACPVRLDDNGSFEQENRATLYYHDWPGEPTVFTCDSGETPKTKFGAGEDVWISGHWVTLAASYDNDCLYDVWVGTGVPASGASLSGWGTDTTTDVNVGPQCDAACNEPGTFFVNLGIASALPVSGPGLRIVLDEGDGLYYPDDQVFEGISDPWGSHTSRMGDTEHDDGTSNMFGIGGPCVQTNAATSVGTVTATINGTLVDLDGAPSMDVYLKYGTESGSYPYTAPADESPMSGAGQFHADINGLNPGMEYFYRAYASGTETVYGSERSFTTLKTEVSSVAATSAGTSTAILNGTLDYAGVASADVSFEYGTQSGSYPYSAVAAESPMSGTGSFHAEISGLTAGTTCYFRAKGEGAGIDYGTELSFTTFQTEVTTVVVTSVGTSTATLNGTLDYCGTSGDVVSFEYGTQSGSYPYSAVAVESPMSGSGAFHADISGLTFGTTYYYRAKGEGAGISYGSEMVTNSIGPISHWAFDSGTGTIAFDSIGNNDGVITGTSWESGGLSGSALEFTWGTNDHVDAGDDESLNLDEDFTIAMWVKRSSLSQMGNVIDFGTGESTSAYASQFLIDIDNSDNGNLLIFMMGDSTYSGFYHVNAGANIPDTEWHHIAVTFSGATSTVYVDGDPESVVTQANSSRISSGVDECYIGARTNGNAAFNGLIDEVSIYNRALSPQEIPRFQGVTQVATLPATNVGTSTATLNGTLDYCGTSSDIVSFEYGTQSGSYPYSAIAAESPMSGTGAFHADINSLIPGTTYYFRAKGDGMGVDYGTELNFITPVITKELTISSIAGGLVHTPGEGVFQYEPGTIVSLIAQNEPGYQFAEWTGDTGAIDDINSPDTIIVMNDDYSITASFEPNPIEVGIYVDLQGANRPPEGWEVPVEIGFFPSASGTLVMGGSPVSTYWFEGVTSGTVTESGTRAYFLCPDPIEPGIYDITVDGITTLLNVKRNTTIAALPHEKSWGTAELIETDDIRGAYSPQVAVDGIGNAIAVWYQYDGTRYNIWSNRYVTGIGWGAEELIEADDAGDAEFPQVAVDGNGNAVAVWVQFNDIWSNRYAAGTGWGTPEIIETESRNAYSPQIAVDGSGNAIAVWYQDDGSNDSIWSNRYAAGTGWGEAELIETNDDRDAEFPQVAVDGSGNAVAVWVQYEPQGHIWSNRYVVGTGWGEAELIETNDAGSAVNPQVAVDSSGNAIAVWYQSDGTRYNIWSNRYAAGTGWGEAELIETNDAGDARYPQVAVDGSGNTIAVWVQYDGSMDSIWSKRYAVGTGWGTAELIEMAVDEAYYPQVAVGGSGNAVAVWVQADGLSLNISSNRYE